MREWLENALAQSELTEEARYYLLGRGATDEVIRSWNLKCFEPPAEPCPQQSLHKHYGAHFERVEGKILFPLYSPGGKLLGFDSRSVEQKDLLRVLLPDAHWNAVWIGMPSAMQGIWDRKTLYVVEGVFDVFALHHAIGDDAVVMGSGPARLSHKQIEFCRRWASEVGIVYDRDDTGRRGTQLALKNLRYNGVECREIPYRGKDPGDIWDQGGAEKVRENFPHL
jgi:DNA primase